MSAVKAAAAALLAAGLVVGVAPGAGAKPSVVSGIEIPFPIADSTCPSTGRVRLYPEVTPGLVVHEEIRAVVDSPICKTVTWDVRVGIIDNAPGYPVKSTAGTGVGSAFAAQNVTYAIGARSAANVPEVVRGPARVMLRTTWVGSNGVRGCIINDWVVASYVDAYEVGPVMPCDDRIQIID
ncbi:MAG TPA: hypothetical protein VNQ77_04040 [Frankiaceae bacterium]|nr:hypothetical protein [Frankiaceae bacterium]